ncbi:alginate export family protein [Hydrogenimonas sp. SS33]|uniref:alginate export family protein n=1 Tax=Hydrogenimonas leucolamina TaxID=2954236 RepID=UPI00336BFEEB
MKRLRWLPLLAATLLQAGSWHPEGYIRERLEVFDGLNKKAYGDASIDAKGRKVGKSDDTMLLQRILAGGRYETGDVDYALILYDARVWNASIPRDAFVKNPGTGEAYVMDPYREYLELFDASVTFRHLFGKSLRLKIGRQDISMGDHRIVGPGTWGNSIGHLWDAARFIYDFRGGWVNLWYGQTRVKDPDRWSLLQKHLFEGVVAYGHVGSVGQGALEPFALYKHTLRPKLFKGEKKYSYLGYAGVRWYAKNWHGFNWDTTYAREFGASGGKSVRAYGYVLKGGYRFDTLPLRPNLVAGRVYASGDDNSDDGTMKTFSTPFGSTDGGHYGRMDIMKWANLRDNQINLHLHLTQRMKMKLSYHDFALAEARDSWRYYGYRNRGGRSDRDLGKESDVQLFWDPSERLHFTCIYAHFHAGAFVRHNVADNDANRLFLQAKYQF